MHFLIAAALSIAASAAYRLIRPRPEPPEAGEIKFPVTTEGAKFPLVYGTVPITRPLVLWYGDRVDDARIDSGFFGFSDTIIGYNYFVGVQYGLCEGEVDSISKLRVADKGDSAVSVWSTDGQTNDVGFDFGDPNTGGEGGWGARIAGYLGSLTQATDSYLAAFQSPLSAYRGRAYLLVRGPTELLDPLGFGPFQIPNPSGRLGVTPQPKDVRCTVTRIAAVNPLSLAGGELNVGTDGAHANAANVIADLITGRNNLNQLVTDLDAASFAAAATTTAGEGNGISALYEREREVKQILRDVEKQINAFVNLDPVDGKWKIKLARPDYSFGALPILDESNVRLVSFRRTTWAGTTNQVNVQFGYFDSTADDWKDESFARAHDGANFAIQGRYVPVTLRFPGLRDQAAANDIAWRELKARGRPWADGVVIGDRSTSTVLPGDVRRLIIGAPLNVDIPVRVTKVDEGDVGDEVKITWSEDVFGVQAGAYENPEDSGWVPPASTAAAVPAAESLVSQVPFAIQRRAPAASLDFLWAAATRQTDETVTKVYAREGTDAYVNEISISTFLQKGALSANVPQNTASPTGSPAEDLLVTGLGYPDAVGSTAFGAVALGQNLFHLVRINDELMLASEIENVDGTNYRLKNVYRGVLDTVRRPHASSDNVFLYITAGGTGVIGTVAHTPAANTDVQLRPVTFSDELPSGAANTLVIPFNNRGRQPYPATELANLGTVYPTATQSLDATTSAGSGLDQVGLDIGWKRRDLDLIDEAAGSSFDGSTTRANREYQFEVIDDPLGAPVSLFTTAFAGYEPPTAALQTLTRTAILAQTDGVVPARLQVVINARHDFDAQNTQVETLQDEQWDFPTSSGLSALKNTGARAQNVISIPFTAAVTDNYVFTPNVGAGLTVQARLNAGAFVNVYTAGAPIPLAVTVGDIVEWRQTAASPATPTHMTIDQQTGPTAEAYGIIV